VSDPASQLQSSEGSIPSDQMVVSSNPARAPIYGGVEDYHRHIRGLNDQYLALKAQLKHNQNAPRMSIGEKKDRSPKHLGG
jgi:hypothetical protein